MNLLDERNSEISGVVISVILRYSPLIIQDIRIDIEELVMIDNNGDGSSLISSASQSLCFCVFQTRLSCRLQVDKKRKKAGGVP